jgi:hypothetical protein
MDSIQTNAIPSDEDDGDVAIKKEPTKKSKSKKPAAAAPLMDDESPQFKYSAEANLGEKTRAKRSLAQDNPSTRKTCSLYIQTDPLFWRHVRDQARHAQQFLLNSPRLFEFALISMIQRKATTIIRFKSFITLARYRNLMTPRPRRRSCRSSRST